MWSNQRKQRRLFLSVCPVLVLLSELARAEAPEPIRYTVKFPAAEKHLAEVEAVVPTEKRQSIELMMPVWSPGFYRVQDYVRRVEGLAARSAERATLEVEQQKNHWKITTGGAPTVIVSYRVTCNQTSVTTNYVAEDIAIINGAPTFATLVEPIARPHEVQIELTPKWKRSVSGLDPAPDGKPDHYRAADYDTLVDSPILAGNPSVHEFAVDGSPHYLVDIGNIVQWDGQKAALELEKIVKENCRFWGSLPFKNYYFLNVLRFGGGGLEHKNSTLLSAGSVRLSNPESRLRWLSFVSHEYFHAFNVKRLRPVELGPFDYEHPPKTSSLWIAEGLTTYFGDLMVVRAGLVTPEDYLGLISASIGQLQNTPGRLVQTLDQSSLDVWTSGMSGFGRGGRRTVSYYVKGPVVGFLLDARIRRATAGKKSFDDVMRLAYKRYSAERGFTPEEFRTTVEEIAGTDLKDWFKRALASTEELDYTDALDWYGLRFVPPEETPSRALEQPATKASDPAAAKAAPVPSSKPAAEAAKPPQDEPARKTLAAATARAAAEPAKKASVPARGRLAEAMRKWKLEIRPNATDAQKEHFRALVEPNGAW
jgi:predicted metalloprotease with PDZ domain